MVEVPSPCTGVCTLRSDEVCAGCGRTIEEIAEWSMAPPERQRVIVEAAAGRVFMARGGETTARK